MKRSIIACLLIVIGGRSQTTVNPDISILGDLLIERNSGDVAFSTSGVELAIQGYVNPFARADIFLHVHDEESPIELEEAFLSVERGLPLGLGLKMGKFRPNFGKINREHAHTYYYILPSVPAQQILGEEMWSSPGMEADVLLPLPWYSNLSVGYYQEGISSHAHQHIDKNANVDTSLLEESMIPPGFTGRWSQFLDLNQVTHVEVGISHFRELGKKDPVTVLAGDIKVKWRPDIYRSLTWQAEWFQKVESAELEVQNGTRETVRAGYIWVNYQFNRIWNTGVILDFSSNLDSKFYQSYGLFVGFSPVEESSVLRVRFHRSHHGAEDPELSLVLQMIWSLGPHKPHRF
ncbi:MAG: hypothetical protein ACE5EE_03545 [Fidelibacterota bacterium]